MPLAVPNPGNTGAGTFKRGHREALSVVWETETSSVKGTVVRGQPFLGVYV